ncbi:MAG: M28 family peptidase [Saprospiraceae bacterium]|nr:M28 family peptidase [Saprospiraceae bacterium]MBP7679515.1 M28 family peptidase [Saprospiraceae bacterium]
MKKIILLGVVLLAVQISCKTDKKDTTTTEPIPEVVNKRRVPVPKFEQDSAYNYVASQVAFGPRVLNTPAHDKCKTYLANTLKSFGATVQEQTWVDKVYTGQQVKATNIIASFNPQHKRRVILAAHWDSRFMADHDVNTARRNEPILGADDGASGVGVLLEIARVIQKTSIDLGVDIILFDAEDQGNDGGNATETWCLGAQYWAANPHVAGYRAMYGILLDMVGAKDAQFMYEEVSMQYGGDIMPKVWSMAGSMGFGNYFKPIRVGGITDDHYFVISQANIPMIDIINHTEAGFGKHWHTHADNMDVIDKNTLRAVGQTVLAVIYNESGGMF